MEERRDQVVEILETHRTRLQAIRGEYHLQMELLEEEVGTDRFLMARERLSFGLGRGSTLDKRIEEEIHELTIQIDDLKDR